MEHSIRNKAQRPTKTWKRKRGGNKTNIVKCGKKEKEKEKERQQKLAKFTLLWLDCTIQMMLAYIVDRAFASIPWRMLKFDGPTVSLNPRTDISGADVLFPSNSWSIKITTTVVSSWKKRLIPLSTFLRSSYLISLFLAATFRAVLTSFLAIPWHLKIIGGKYQWLEVKKVKKKWAGS